MKTASMEAVTRHTSNAEQTGKVVEPLLPRYRVYGMQG